MSGRTKSRAASWGRRLQGCPSPDNALICQHSGFSSYRSWTWQAEQGAGSSPRHGEGMNQASWSIQKQQRRGQWPRLQCRSERHLGDWSKTGFKTARATEKFFSVWIVKTFMLAFMLWDNLSSYFLVISKMEYCNLRLYAPYYLVKKFSSTSSFMFPLYFPLQFIIFLLDSYS